MAWALFQIGRVLHAQAKYAEAVVRLERLLDLLAEIGDHAGTATVMNQYMLAYKELGQHEKAHALGERLRARCEARGDQVGVSATLVSMGTALAAMRDRARALEYFDRGLAVAQKIGHQEWIKNALTNAGLAYLELGDHGKALANFQQVLAIDQRYTFDDVNPIKGGNLEQLAAHTNTDDLPIVKNPNFGNPTAYQLPRQFRFGIRLTF